MKKRKISPVENIQTGGGSPQFSCYRFDPLEDFRWTKFLDANPDASVFHTAPWLRALKRTYGYEPVAFTTTPSPNDLKNGIAFCSINSWLTGRRLVSLPFSDHGEPLCDSAENLSCMLLFLQAYRTGQNWKYLQVRPLHDELSETYSAAGFLPSEEYYFHSLDLTPSLEDIFNGLDRDSVQRRIQRAERATLTEKSGRSQDLLQDFYGLFLMTRRRQRVPPTPRIWFQNLVDEMGEALEIRVAYKENTPVASILNLQYKDIVYYKYGCSDALFSNYGATPWLFWNAITSAKSKGFASFDLGRTERDNPGLLAFKNHWAPNPKRLIYWRYPSKAIHDSTASRKWNLAKSAFAHIPDRLQVKIGEFLYPHIG